MKTNGEADGSFRGFEHEAWRNAADGYASHWRSLTVQAASHLLNATDVRGGGRVLDVATGPGDIAIEAASLGAETVGIDFSEEMIAIAGKGATSESATFLVGDAEALDFLDDTFDAVIMNFGMLHLAEPEKAMGEAARVLKPGGKFAFTVWATPDQAQGFRLVLDAVASHGRPIELPKAPDSFTYANKEAARSALQRSGFVNVSSHSLPLIWKLSRPSDVFEAYFAGTARTGALLRQQSPDAQTLIAKEMAAKARAFAVDNGIQIPMPAVMSVGTAAG